MNNNDKLLDEPEPEHMSTEENTSSESFKPLRQRSDSTSSCTSVTSSDDEGPSLELTGRGNLNYEGVLFFIEHNVYLNPEVLKLLKLFLKLINCIMKVST